jgi:hypothetical protein
LLGGEIQVALKSNFETFLGSEELLMCPRLLSSCLNTNRCSYRCVYCKHHLVVIENGLGKPVSLCHRMKGSDASWEDNNEPPPKCLDYSDDEEERKARSSFQLGERKVKI